MVGKKKDFAEHIEQSADKLLASKGKGEKFWLWASRIGVGGWLFAIPVVTGAYLGKYLDQNRTDGISWTVTFILLGIAAGTFNLWQFLLKKGGS